MEDPVGDDTPFVDDELVLLLLPFVNKFELVAVLVMPPSNGFIWLPNDTIAELTVVDDTVDDEGRMYPPVEYPFDAVVDELDDKLRCDDAIVFSTRSIDANGIWNT